ncbi:MAG TPA: bifunctional oligoribonuclease/PAP phosphatase NrnA [Thermomicrobiales bacterium]|nr:bifunctional oligoribonuclease/PAP phosphatase NrnA [Thermomicrobiales bacterium]
MTSGWRLDAQAAHDALNQLKAATRILMPTHQNVDADSLSSVLALTIALRQHGLDVVPMVSDGSLPHALEFLPGADEVLLYTRDEVPEYDMLCLADCSDRTRLGRFYKDDPSRLDGRVPIVNIDHHITNARFGVVNIVEPSAASATEIIADVLAVWGTVLTREIAQCLLAGIYGDTLGLRTESTTSRTMRTAADLVDAGANPVPIVDALFRLKPKSSVCLWRKALEGVQWTGELIWTELTEETFAECGAQPSEAEGMVNFLAGTEGSRAAAILFANDHGWRISMRSLPVDVDVAAITAEFGGGGHPRAAGVQIEGGEAEKQHFLSRVAELIAEPRVE